MPLKNRNHKITLFLWLVYSRGSCPRYEETWGFRLNACNVSTTQRPCGVLQYSAKVTVLHWPMMVSAAGDNCFTDSVATDLQTIYARPIST